MNNKPAIAVLGTFDSKGEEHLFLKEAIEARGFAALTINVGTKGAPSFPPDIDLRPSQTEDRDQAIAGTIARARDTLAGLYARGEIAGVISAGGGTGTHLGSSVMKVLPLGAPKVMVSTVAAHDMAQVVGTKDMTMIHSVGDLLGVNSLVGRILDRAAGAVCGMVEREWSPPSRRRRIGLTMFGFITPAAEAVKAELEDRGFEVIAFHANGTGGLALEELAAEGMFDGILDLAPHELPDTLKNGYCKLIGPGRLEPTPGKSIPRLVVPGGLDCAVLEFTRDTVPPQYADRKIFYYDFRSAVRLDREESIYIADELSGKLSRLGAPVRVLNPTAGWSAADGEGAPLYDPDMSRLLMERLKKGLNGGIPVTEVDLHINDPAFAPLAASAMAAMLPTG